MENELLPIEQMTNTLETKRNNYVFKVGNYDCELIRDVDFGKVQKAKTPSLWKSGAEKVLLGYGLYYDTVITDSYKDHAKGYFYYEVEARAFDKNGRVVRTGVGCANTTEKSTGFASGFDTANSALKKAKKRAVVDLALTLASLSNCFTQDMEDEGNEERAKKLQKETDFINSKQIQRIFAIASSKAITTEDAKNMIKAMGFESTKDITVKDYDRICEKFEHYRESDDTNK